MNVTGFQKIISLILVYALLMIPVSSCGVNASKTKAVIYAEDEAPLIADVEFCSAPAIKRAVKDSFTSFLFMETLGRGQTEELESRILTYASNIQNYGIETMLAKLIAIKYPLKLAITDEMVDEISPGQCRSLGVYAAAKSLIRKKWNDSQLLMPYPSTLQSKCAPKENLTGARFDAAFADPIKAELANLCLADPNATRFFKRPSGGEISDWRPSGGEKSDWRESNAVVDGDIEYDIMDYAVNATVAGAYFQQNPDDLESKIAFCALIDSEQIKKGRIKTFDALAPWLGAGAGISIGILGSVFGSTAGAIAADLGLVAILVAKHLRDVEKNKSPKTLVN